MSLPVETNDRRAKKIKVMIGPGSNENGIDGCASDHMKPTGKEAIMPQQMLNIDRMHIVAILCQSNFFLVRSRLWKLIHRKSQLTDDIFM